MGSASRCAQTHDNLTAAVKGAYEALYISKATSQNRVSALGDVEVIRCDNRGCRRCPS